jgi:membrane-associated phospholipid phosphatase
MPPLSQPAVGALNWVESTYTYIETGYTSVTLFSEPAKFREKYAIAVLALVVELGSYVMVGHATSNRHVELMSDFDRAIPFWPWTVWLYLPLFVLFFHVAVFLIRRWEVYFRALASLFLVSATAYVVFFFAPSTYPRPVVPRDGSLTGELFAFLHFLDPPNNTFPSLHVAMMLTIVLACIRDDPKRGKILLALAVWPALSIVTTKQHYIVDLFGGAVLAVFAHLVTFELTKGFKRNERGRVGMQ